MIRENQKLILKNVMSFRGKITQSQMQEEMRKIGQVMQKLDVKKMNMLLQLPMH